jgi:hypothetical protein
MGFWSFLFRRKPVKKYVPIRDWSNQLPVKKTKLSNYDAQRVNKSIEAARLAQVKKMELLEKKMLEEAKSTPKKIKGSKISEKKPVRNIFRNSKYPKAFDRAFKHILKWEGGSKLTNDPSDPGGLTRYGISLRAHPSVDIRNLTEAGAKKIYFEKYYKKIMADKIKHPMVSIYLFDMGVNMGNRQAVKIFQRAINITGRNNRRLTVDGRIGKKTIAAANAVDGLALYHAMEDFRNLFYKAIIKRNSKLAKFRRGWKNRTYAKIA